MPRRLRTPRLPKSCDPPLELLHLDTVFVTKDPGAPVATVILNRPRSRNALNYQTLRDIEKAFSFLQGRYDVRVVVLAGAGQSFSAGHDLKSADDPFETDTLQERMHRLRQGARTIAAIRDIDAITIARVHGHAIGGGFGLMQACDLRCVTRDALMYFPEIDLGNPVPWGLTPMLVRDIGLPVAKELMLLGSELSPDRAAQLGLVNRVCHDEATLDVEVEELAYSIAAKPSSAVTLAKSQFRSLQHTSSSGDVVDYEADWMILCRTHSRL